MAIDQEIQQKVDAYRSNPQALQQRYAQNQQLVDLLALQKIKSEMDAAKRDIQMKMQQQPGTIKQQREQELMERTKQDMMDQTAGVMRQKQAQQQQNLQKVAQGGLGALAPQRPPAPAPAQQIANQKPACAENGRRWHRCVPTRWSKCYSWTERGYVARRADRADPPPHRLERRAKAKPY
jgi:hypothetical protein